MAGSGNSRVDYVLAADGKDVGLLEAKSPSVMNNVGGLLPQNGFKLTWAPGQTLAPKMLTQVSMLYSSPTRLALKKYM